MRAPAVLVVVLLASAGRGADLHVEVGGLDAGSCPFVAPCGTVGYAIAQAAIGGGDTVHVGDGTFVGDVVIDRPVSVEGTGSSIIAGTGAGVVLLWNGPGDLTLRGLEIRGGGLGATYSGGLHVSDGNVLIEDCSFTAIPAGAAITQDGGMLTIRRTTMSDNGTSTIVAGGGIVVKGGSLDAEDCRIERNVADLNGVGLQIRAGGQARLLRTSIRSNRGRDGRSPAGILISGTASLEECDITDNSPGAVGIVGAETTPHATIDRCTIVGNAGSSGAGVYVRGGDLLLRDSLVAGNVSSTNAGGLHACGVARIERCAFVGNSTTGPLTDGGGVNVTTCSGTFTWRGAVTLIDCTLSGNSSVRGGGGVSVSNADFRAYGCTIAFNSAGESGGGVSPRSTGSVVELAGTIVSNNISGTCCPDMVGAWTSLGHNLVGNGTGSVASGMIATDLLGVDPLLEALADNGGATPSHALGACSPAIDSGDCLGPDASLLGVDQRGSVRPTDGDCDGVATCDRGALEWISCGSGFTLFECAIPQAVVQSANVVANPSMPPYAHAAPVAPILFYQVEACADMDPIIFVARDGATMSFDW
jgi:hypothetical protein